MGFATASYYKIISKCRNAWKKVSLSFRFLPFVDRITVLSAFRHHGQSGTVGQRLFRHCQDKQNILHETNLAACSYWIVDHSQERFLLQI